MCNEIKFLRSIVFYLCIILLKCEYEKINETKLMNLFITLFFDIFVLKQYHI